MTDKEAMELALEALESCTPLDTSSSHVIYPWYDEKLVDKAITALKARLALQILHDENERLGLYRDAYAEQEHMKPTAWYDPSNGVVSTDKDCSLFTPLGQVWPLYPKHEWVGLTDEEMLECNMDGDFMVDRETAKLNVQAKLKEKNT